MTGRGLSRRRGAATLALVSIVVVGCGIGAEDDGGPVLNRRDGAGRVVLSLEERLALELLVQPAAVGSLAVPALRFGRVTAAPADEALIVAPFAGRLGVAVLAPGADVMAGEPLVTLEPLFDAAALATLRAEAYELEGQLEGARARLIALESERDRVDQLVGLELATTADQTRAEAELTAARAALDSMVRSGAALKSVVGGPIELSVPIDGRVVEVHVRAGDVVPQGTRLLRVLRSGPRWVELPVPPTDAIGVAYRVRVGEEESLEARLLSRGDVVGPDGTRIDRLVLPAEALLLPGMTAVVEVVQSREGLVLPASAVVARGRERLVFVELQEGRFEARTVTVAARAGGRVLIGAGLAPGHRVVVRGAPALLGELEGAAPAAVPVEQP